MKLEKLNYGKNRYHKILLYGLISVVVLLLALTLITSRANYKINSSVQLAKGKISYKAPDLNVVAMYINDGDGNYTELLSDTTIPKEGYTINATKSYCYKTTSTEHDNTVKFNTDILGQHIIENLSRNDKCYLYFDKINYEVKTMSELLETHYKTKSIRSSETKDFNVPFGETTYGVVYEAEDDYGTSYYFAGAPLDNWVKFGKQNEKDMWWRIIRINGNGSIRMIYSGTNAPTSSQASVMTGEQTQIGRSVYNALGDGDNMYVGFYYTNNQIHGFEKSSTIYSNPEGDINGTSLKGFYEKNIKDQSYEKWVDKNVGFCNDRVPYTNNNPDSPVSGGGTGTTQTYYASFLRVRPGDYSVTASTEIVKPSLKCSYQGTSGASYKDSDLFTAKNTTDIGLTHGNKLLDYPVGLITADEVSYAGMVYNILNSVSTNYLFLNSSYFTMSSAYKNPSNVTVVVVYAGFLGDSAVNFARGVVPVINIKADTPLIGNGTYNNPYRLAE